LNNKKISESAMKEEIIKKFNKIEQITENLDTIEEHSNIND